MQEMLYPDPNPTNDQVKARQYRTVGTPAYGNTSVLWKRAGSCVLGVEGGVLP